MVEYGNGVGQVAGQAGGSAGGGGGVTDLGAAVVQAVSNGIDTVSSWPPELLVGAAIVVLVFLVLLKRAF